jgi:hypothetical protein
MGMPVVTVAAGGMPVVDVTATKPLLGMPVTEAANKYGLAVTKVAAYGLPVTFVSPPLVRRETLGSDDDQIDRDRAGKVGRRPANHRSG